MENLPKLILTDIDGVWTDGGMYYDNLNNEFKKFNVKDGAGVIYLRLLNIPVGIITGENTEIVQRRAKKLQIEHLYMGVKNKFKVVKKLLSSLNIPMKEVAYIGDDINDINLLSIVGFSATTNDAPDYIKRKVHYVTKCNGGEGAFREFIEKIITDQGVMSEVLEKYLKENSNSSEY